ncbi:MAG: class I SAM-dependent methyltransferase [Chloroflexi bacterium]|nr:MAG: class I SAM-dependent methyltransferase [Chloroflexota bacterium]
MRWRADFDAWKRKRLWQENYQRDALAEIARYASIQNARVLDLGAGMGGFAVAMQRAGARIDALDYNFAYCEIARTRARRYNLNLAALVGAGEALPFAAQSFDVATCWDVLEHVQTPRRLLSEIARVLTDNGVAFLTVINRYALVDPHYHLRFVNYIPRSLGEKYIALRQRTKDSPLRDKQKLSEMHYYTYDGFAKFAAACGFQILDLNQPKSRFQKYPRAVGDALYYAWRAWGMGTYRLVLQKIDIAFRARWCGTARCFR